MAVDPGGEDDHLALLAVDGGFADDPARVPFNRAVEPKSVERWGGSEFMKLTWRRTGEGHARYRRHSSRGRDDCRPARMPGRRWIVERRRCHLSNRLPARGRPRAGGERGARSNRPTPFRAL